MDKREHRIAVVMFVDIDNFSRMMEKNEDSTLQVLESLKQRLEAASLQYNGNIIKTAGGSTLLDFRTTTDAAKCAIALQRLYSPMESGEDNLRFADGSHVFLRIGIHLGDIHFLGNDALGEGVNITLGLKSICKPGRIYISSEVYSQVVNKITRKIRPLGRLRLNTVSREIDAYEIIPFPSEEQTNGYANSFSHGNLHNSEESIDFHELKDLILEQVRYAGTRIREERNRTERKSRSHSAKKGPPKEKDDDFSSSYEDYRKRIIRKASPLGGGLLGHIISYLTVNGFLVFLNAAFSPGFFWAAFPLFGWGIGLLTHISRTAVHKKQKRDVENFPKLTNKEFRLLRKMHSAHEKFVSHIASTVGVSLFLIVVYRITTPGSAFFWPVFPIAAMGIGLLSHIGRYVMHRGELGKGPQIKESEDILKQAIRLKEGISKSIKSLDKKNAPIGEEMLPILDNFLEQIRQLSEKNGELDQILGEIPKEDLSREKQDLEVKLKGAGTEFLKGEYLKSIAETEKQIRSYEELKDQKEVISLRLSSAVNSLKQMQLDIARIRTINSGSEQASVQMLRQKAEELSSYLGDLRESYRELEGKGNIPPLH